MQLFAKSIGMTIPQVLSGSMIAELGGNPLENPNPTPEQQVKMSNATNTEGQFGLIALIFEGSNPSQLLYSNALDDGIINFADITSANDPHQYIELTLAHNFGRALLFNLNYLPQA